VTGLRWVAIAASLTLVYMAIELAARWWIRHRRQYYVFPPGLRLRLRIDSEVFPQMERDTRFDVNRHGERGDEPPRSADGLYRILVAGGSQPEGFFLDQDSSWPGALQRMLEKPEGLGTLGAAKVHVGSIARSGVGSEALDLIFDRVLPRYPRLQLIVILVGATDVLRWLECAAPQRMPSVVASDVFRCHPEGPFGWKPRNLAVVELLLRARRRWLRPIHVHERAGRWYQEARAMRARAKTVRTVVPEPAPMLDAFEQHFRRLLQKAKGHADRVLVVRQPWLAKDFSPEEAATMWHGGLGQVWREEVSTYYSFDVVSRLMSHLDARVSAVADALEVEQLDLMPILEPSLATYYDCFHATPAGAKAVAAAVSASILRQGLPHSLTTPAQSTFVDRESACAVLRAS